MQGLVSRSLFLLGREAAKIVLPSDCVVCERSLPWDDRIASCCRGCWDELPRIEEAKCRRCAYPWDGSAGGEFVCLDCRGRQWSLSWIDSWGHYREALEKTLFAFKFRRHDFLARPLADLLFQILRDRRDVFFDQVVPIPMHRKKLRLRGYNQSELLAIPLSRAIGAPVRRRLVKRVDNATQSRLPKAERSENVRGVFSVSGRVQGDRLLLVDDICTTGETLNEAARALLASGAASVCAITIARA
ncbi:MAG: ComF family protein [Thermoanaerobaculia bacterium]|nr:ComF family protein [Thermoanaerobaculia bacterium]